MKRQTVIKVIAHVVVLEDVHDVELILVPAVLRQLEAGWTNTLKLVHIRDKWIYVIPMQNQKKFLEIFRSGLWVITFIH